MEASELDNAILRNLLSQTTRAYEHQMSELFAEKELAQVTLASIGDGVPAVEWYRRFFSVDGAMAPMPETAYRFPLIIEGPAPERRGLYRTMRHFDQPAGAVTYWGAVQTGDQVRLGMGNGRSLVHTASQLTAGPAPEAAILYSCVGRETVLGGMAPEEVSTIHRALGGAALSGFFTFGEIGPTPGGGLAFYNQTAILVLLSEVCP